MDSNIYADHVSFRRYMVDNFVRQVFGPDHFSSDENRAELLQVPPLQLYATGVLFPQKLQQELLEDSTESGDSPDEVQDGDFDEANVDAGGRRAAVGADDGSTYETEPLNLANEFSPSALGISFRVADATDLKIRITYGTYKPEKFVENHPRAGRRSTDGSLVPEVRESMGFRRRHHEYLKEVTLPTGASALEPIDIGDADSGLKLHIAVRQRHDSTLIVSAMAVNHIISGGAVAPNNADCFFQVRIEVEHAEGQAIFMPIDKDVGSANDSELASLELLYRHRRAFALGHGVAGDWNRDERLSEDGRVDRVASAAVPTYDLKPIKPRTTPYGDRTLNLSMRFLAEGGEGGDARQQILSALNGLADDYRDWIDDVGMKAQELAGQLKAAAARHIDDCRSCLHRIERGISVLASDDNALLAFRLMNKAMLVQQYHSSVLSRRDVGTVFPTIPEGYRNLPGGDRRWRPFQIAFVLMNVASMTDEDDEERKLVDLIWFPTGGGKTEAYLGLAAFSICWERIHDRAAGTTVLMRYTLRLLTAQQFQRASALILALEMIRRGRDFHADIGEEEISIGLWVGQSLSPNRRSEARAALKKLKKEKYAQNPFQVLNCPWCGIDLTDTTSLGYVEMRRNGASERTVKLACPDQACPYHSDSGGLPIYVIDDDIYDTPPTLLIGTVDKFAQISWKDSAGRLFSIGTGHTPPCLIIQDELHLISGPLGTIVGLYETAIDRLCSRDGHTHKIVASTATIRRASEQCRDLYDRETFEFPPQGIRAGDSYFAYEDMTSPGRLYVGLMATAVKSHQTALVRACSPLLQSVRCGESSDDAGEEHLSAKQEIVDPYGTLVWYFNSLRELGHAATLCTGDIPEFLKGLCHRLKIPPDERRYVREIVELTSRRSADEIPDILKRLEVSWQPSPKGSYPVDVLLATNMIAVGVDVSRLGLIVMSGQPKSAAEYIQASSRVGRQHPGLVITVYTQNKSRDRSHYERFVAYHQSVYKYVEPTSVTPFSPQARERALRGLLVALARHRAGVKRPDQIADHLDAVKEEVDFILSRIGRLDEDEEIDAEHEIRDWLEFWGEYSPPEYGEMGGTVDTPTLVYPFGSPPHPIFQAGSWPQMTSMRNVDGTCAAQVLNIYDVRTSGE